MDWRIKAHVQGILARLPAGVRVNDLLQTAFGGRSNQAEHIELKFRADWLVLMEMLQQHDFDVNDKVLLEIGTGWLPVLPLCFALAGARQVLSYDMHRHLLPQSAPTVLHHLQPQLGLLAQACNQPVAAIESRHAWFSAAPDGPGLLQRAGVRYHAPADASATGLAAGTIDLVFSNSVLEHVSKVQLESLMREAARLIGPGGCVLHSVNCADHYAYFDRSISPIHYLRFSEAQWQRWNNALLFQNRLRPRDFTEAAKAAGMQVSNEIRTVRQEVLAKLPQTPIAHEFAQYSADELCCTSVTFLAQCLVPRT